MVLQVWKGIDAISDRGLHSYLQHHWVIFKLMPDEEQTEGSEAATGTSEAKSSWGPIPGDTSPANVSYAADELRDLENGQTLDRHTAVQILERDGASHLIAESDLQRDKVHSKDSTCGATLTNAQHSKGSLPAWHDKASRTSQSHSPGGIPQEPSVKLSTEACLDAEQSKELQPTRDCGMHLADSGRPWFLRVDR